MLPVSKLRKIKWDICGPTKVLHIRDMVNPPPPIYLDSHSTTPVDPRVLEVMLPYFTEKFGNAASSNHAFGSEAADAVELARGQVAELLNVSPKSLVFTSGATEANNIALKGMLSAQPPGSHLITNAAEHPSVLDPARRMERSGLELTILPVDSCGMVDPDQVEAAIQPNTVLVSVMFANNEVGTINPVSEIGRVCRERGIVFHCDAAQAIGKIPVDLGALPIDVLSLGAHKLYGPKGVGVLYVRRGSPRIVLEPLFHGGSHERHLRSGTLPVPLVVGCGAACKLAGEMMLDEARSIAMLRDRLWDGIQAAVTLVRQNGHPQHRLPHNLNVSFEGVDGDALMAGLGEIAVSSGSACTTASPQPSHVLRAMGVSEPLARASLRFGLGRFNTPQEIDFAVNRVAATVKRLRGSTNC